MGYEGEIGHCRGCEQSIEERDELRAQVDKLTDKLAALKNNLLHERKEKAKVDAELREMLRTSKVTDLTVRVSKKSIGSQARNAGASPLEISLKVSASAIHHWFY